jgi:hypothetical protein
MVEKDKFWQKTHLLMILVFQNLALHHDQQDLLLLQVLTKNYLMIDSSFHMHKKMINLLYFHQWKLWSVKVLLSVIYPIKI